MAEKLPFEGKTMITCDVCRGLGRDPASTGSLRGSRCLACGGTGWMELRPITYTVDWDAEKCTMISEQEQIDVLRQRIAALEALVAVLVDSA